MVKHRSVKIPQKKKRIIFIVGPTASGKSALALALAKSLGGEIISADSMQVYQGMDILTSQPAGKSSKEVPHYLVNMLSQAKEYDVSQYRKDALRKINQIIKKGKQPILTGGTGLYINILLDGIFLVESQDKVVRQRLMREAESAGSRQMHERLKEVDPLAAQKIHPNDAKRIVRALEIFEVTGKPISLLQKQRKGLSDSFEIRIFGLNMARPDLYRRIDQRVDGMIRAGIVEEVKKVLKKKLGRTAGYAIGIKEIKGYLDGLYDITEAKRLMQQATRQYAKRQLTWFRKDKRIEWLDVAIDESPVSVAKRIEGRL